jgi:hypothetical protein
MVPVAFVQIPWCRDPNRCFAQTSADSAGGITEMVNTSWRRSKHAWQAHGFRRRG